MDELAKNFLNEDKENRALFIEGIIFKDQASLELLNKKFNNYLFRIYLYSYVQKTILFAARELKKKQRELRRREELSLNVADLDFEEERINMIPDSLVDFAEEIEKHNGNPDYREIFSDSKMLAAIDALTNRQKQIIYKCIIQDKTEGEVANELGITKQAVSKIKKAGLNKLKKEIEEG